MQIGGAKEPFLRSRTPRHQNFQKIIYLQLFAIFVLTLLNCANYSSATSSTSSPPTTLWRLLVPSGAEEEEESNDLKPCNKSRRQIINSTFGVISDGPGNYTQDTTCEWLIEAPKGHWISLHLDEVKTECSYDYLFIFDGNSYKKGQGRLLASFSGDSRPQVTLLAQSGYMLLLLFSDPNYTLNGFRAEYSISTCPLNCSAAGECIQIQNEHICKCHESRSGFACQDKISQDKHLSQEVTTTISIFSTKENSTDDGDTDNINPIQKPLPPEPNYRFLISANYKSPLARVGHSVVQIENLLYIFGGYDLNDILDDLWVLDLDGGNVSQIFQSHSDGIDSFWPKGRYGHSAVAYNDGFLVYGGHLRETGITDELLYYNLKKKEWTYIPSSGRLPALAYHSMTRAGLYVYVYGGGTRWGGFSHSLYRFKDPSDWELIVSSCCGKPEERSVLGHSMTYDSIRNTLVLYGGVGAAEIGRFSKLSNNVFLYLIDTNTWLKIDTKRNGGQPFITLERAFHTAHIVDNYLIILGGYSHVHNKDETCYATFVIVYSIECHVFLPLKASMKLEEGIFAHQSLVWKDEFVLIGGYRGYLSQKLTKLPLPFSNRTTESCSDYDKEAKSSWQCASDPRCGWCPSSKRCLEKTSSSNCTTNLHTVQCPGICSALTGCLSCTVKGMNCTWCDFTEQCWKKDDMRDNCVSKPFSNKSQKHEQSECFDKRQSLGLTLIEYRFPIDLENPDNVRITNASVLILPRDYAGGTGNNREVISEMRGFIEYHTNFPPGKRLEICTSQTEANVTLSSYEGVLNQVFNWTDHHHCHNLTYKSNKTVLLSPDMRLQFTVLAKSFGPEVKQDKSGRVIIQSKSNAGFRHLKKENLRPYEKVENCSIHKTCFACLVNALCAWESAQSKCLNRTTKVFTEIALHPVVLRPEECPTCNDKRFCEECLRKEVGGVECEWDEVDATCNRKGRHENHTIKSVGECPLECHDRKNCTSCLNSPGCVWCEQQKECFVFSVYTSIYQFGKCYQWADKPDMCSRCSKQLKCEPCVGQMGCGWLYDDHGGLCTEGDFSGPYTLPTDPMTVKSGIIEVPDFEMVSEDLLQDLNSKPYENKTWTYSVCPDIDECALNIHDCNHPNATCINTPGSYKCLCNAGFTGDGRTCEKTCLHPCVHGFCSSDFVCHCDLGWSGVDCSIDCGCNYHSYCENGTCDKCEDSTTGSRCEICEDRTYGNATLVDVGCQPCSCNGHGDEAQGICDKITGTCHCLQSHNTEGNHCQRCKEGYYGDPRNGQPCYKKCGGRVFLNGSEGFFGFLPETYNVYPPKLSRNMGTGVGHQVRAIPVITHCLWLIHGAPEDEQNDITDEDGNSLEPMQEELIIEIGREYKIPCARNGLQIYSNWAGSRYHAPLIATVCSDDYDTADVRKTVIISIPGRNAAVLFQFAQMGMVKFAFNASFRVIRKRVFPHPSSVIAESPIKISKLYDGRSVLSRFGHSLHLESKNMWIFGGYSLSHGPLNDIRHYDRESGMWVPLTITVVQNEEAVPSARYFHAGTLTPSNSIFIHGGITSNITFLSDTWRFDTRLSRWSKVHDEGPLLAGHTITVKRDRFSYLLIMIGGVNPKDGFSDRVYTLQGPEGWVPMETIGSSPVGLYGHSAVYHQQSDTIYVFGGMFYESHNVIMSPRLFSLHLPTRRWSVLPPSEENYWPTPLLFPPRKLFHTAVSTDSYMLVIGGSGNTRNVSLLAYVYACNTWQAIDQPQGQSELGRVAAAGAIYGQQVLSMGGLRKGSATESIYQINVPEDILCSIYNSSEERCKLAQYCSVCSSDNDEKEQCYRSELDMPEKCSSGATNIRFWSGKACSLTFQEQKCERLRTCGECLAVWPTAAHPNASQGCSWCTTNFNLGRCISASKTCESENQREQKQRTISDSSYCADCSAAECEKCGSSGCIWSRQIIRNAQRGIEVRFSPNYDWSCVPKFILNSSNVVVNSSPPMPCPKPCSYYTTCKECVKSSGNEGGFSSCRWSIAFKKCISPAHTPLMCFGGVCGAILQSDPELCPLDCSVLKSCSACLQNPLCGWCSEDGKNGEGVCVAAEKVVGEGFSCGPGFNWSYQICPKENECTNLHHDCDSVSEECIDLEQGYRCDCKHGFERTLSGSGCLPICTPPCVHGKCVSPNKCQCHFGYVGKNCMDKCNCNGHSNCLENDLNNCINCLNNTQGPHCANCKAFYVGDPKNNGACISCSDYCNAHSSICLSEENYNRWCNGTPRADLDLEALRDEIIASGVNSGPTNRAYCCGCANNTSGNNCAGCLPGHFRSYQDLRQPCRKCECHGHSDTCNPENGLNCQCGNNTESDDCSPNAIKQSTHQQCWKVQCAKCKDHYLGTPTFGHQCYRQLNVDQENCFLPESKSCPMEPDPLLAGRTSFFAIQPKFLNVNLRIWLDVTQGAINVYLASQDDTFLVHYDNHSNLHKVEFDTKYGLSGIRNDLGRKTPPGKNAFVTQDGGGNEESETDPLDLFLPNLSSMSASPTRMTTTTTTATPGMGYSLIQIEAAGFASYHTVDDQKAVLLVKNLRNRLVVTLPQERHDLRSTRFYLILEGVGDKSVGSIFFRQDQQHIDLFVFFSVFFSSFFIFLSLCGVMYKFKQTIDIRRARQRHVDEMLSMAKRPFAVTTVILEPDPNSHLHEAYTQCRKVCRKGCICLRPIAVEYTTERGGASSSSNAAVCTMLVTVAGGPAAPVRMCLASVLVSLRPYPTHNIVRRRRIQTQ